MNKSILLAGFALIVLSACKEESDKPKVIYDNAKSKPQAARASDTAQIAIADLPVIFTGTNILIHPIGDLRVYSGAKYSGSGSDGVSYTTSNYNEFELTGYLKNLKFQVVGTDSLFALTDKPVMIQTASYLKGFADKNKTQLLVYTLSDMDTNKDQKIDASDIKTLYISSIDGKGFRKLSSDYEELIDWRIIDATKRLYFRTIEDTNKNGEFDKSDNLHYQFADLTAADFAVTRYEPLK